MAAIEYWEQEGENRQTGPNSGEIRSWYSRMSSLAIKTPNRLFQMVRRNPFKKVVQRQENGLVGNSVCLPFNNEVDVPKFF